MEPYAAAFRGRCPDTVVTLAQTPEQGRKLIADASVVTGITVEPDLVEATSNLELFACVFVGTDHVPVGALAARGIPVTNATGIHTPGIAEQPIGSMFVFARRFHEARRRRGTAEWRRVRSVEFTDSAVPWDEVPSAGHSPGGWWGSGSTTGARYTPSTDGPTDVVYGFEREAVHRALSRSDAVVVNVAHGRVIDTPELVEALGSDTIRDAALDVTHPEPLPGNHPLWRPANRLITPHAGGHAPGHWDRLADIVGKNTDRLESGTELLGEVRASANQAITADPRPRSAGVVHRSNPFRLSASASSPSGAAANSTIDDSGRVVVYNSESMLSGISFVCVLSTTATDIFGAVSVSSDSLINSS